jgi:hypothetical protein
LLKAVPPGGIAASAEVVEALGRQAPALAARFRLLDPAFEVPGTDGLAVSVYASIGSAPNHALRLEVPARQVFHRHRHHLDPESEIRLQRLATAPGSRAPTSRRLGEFDYRETSCRNSSTSAFRIAASLRSITGAPRRDPEDGTRLLAAGFQAHLRKPIDPDEIVAAIASLRADGQR